MYILIQTALYAHILYHMWFCEGFAVLLKDTSDNIDTSHYPVLNMKLGDS